MMENGSMNLLAGKEIIGRRSNRSASGVCRLRLPFEVLLDLFERRVVVGLERSGWGIFFAMTQSPYLAVSVIGCSPIHIAESHPRTGSPAQRCANYSVRATTLAPAPDRSNEFQADVLE